MNVLDLDVYIMYYILCAGFIIPVVLVILFFAKKIKPG
jgi:hypothetical protein